MNHGTQIKDNLSTVVDISERAIRPLTKIKDPEEQREVYQKAVETAPEGKVTAKHVERVVKKKSMAAMLAHPLHIGKSFMDAWENMAEEIKRENLNRWKETGKKEARELIEKLLILIH